MIKGECGVDVIYVVQKVEEVQIIFLRNSGSMIPESCKKAEISFVTRLIAVYLFLTRLIFFIFFFCGYPA